MILKPIDSHDGSAQSSNRSGEDEKARYPSSALTQIGFCIDHFTFVWQVCMFRKIEKGYGFDH
jgi:hypothetical protein